MVRNSPAYPRTYFQPMLKIEQQWKPAKEKEGSGAGLQCGTQPPQSWPPWANFTNNAGLGYYFWQFLLSKNEENGTKKDYCSQHNSQIKLFSHIQVPSSVGECKGEAISVGERRQTSGTQHVLYYPSLWHWNILDRKMLLKQFPFHLSWKIIKYFKCHWNGHIYLGL